jgi:predicted ABC-type ATPase
MSRPPHLIVIAGPNGAGKSTTAPSLLVDTLKVQEFVNADTIARGLSGLRPDQTALEAGRIMLRRIRQLADDRADFAFETTLASRSFAPWIEKLRESGYFFGLIFLWLPSPELAIARVLDRVHGGGNNVPEETVRRRYQRGLENFFNLYQPLSDRWQIIGNSSSSGPRPIAEGMGRRLDNVEDVTIWTQLTAEFSR